MSQTSVAQSGQARAFAGLIQHREDALSGFNTQADEIEFGTAVAVDSGERSYKRVSAVGNTLHGILGWSADHVPGTNGDLGTVGLKQNASLLVVHKGRMWARLDADPGTVTAGVTRLYTRFETDGGANTVVGRLRATDDTHVIDTTSRILALSGVVTAADGSSKLCLVQVDFTNV